jgi:dipeptidyl-peptidase-4
VLFLRSATGEDSRTGLWVLDVADGVERPVVDPAADDDLTAAERARRERAREGASGVVSYAADAAGRIAAYVVGGRLAVVDIDDPSPRLLGGSTACFDPRPDPTGEWIGYVDGASLRVIAADGSGDRLLAGEDSDTVSWGRAEFVAAEEMNRFRGFWWAPDGGSLLAARVDEAPVQQWWVADPAHPENSPTALRYPAAGTDDAAVTLWHIDLDGRRREIDWDRNRSPYLGRVSWSAAGPPLIAVMSADQRELRVLSVDVASGGTTELAVDTDPAWVEFGDGVPAWSGDALVRIVADAGGRRLWVGDTAVTPPEHYVRSVAAVSPGEVVYGASVGDPTRIGVYRWTSAAIEAIAVEPGIHRAVADGATVVVASAGLDHDGSSTVVRHETGEHSLASYAVSAPFVPAVRMLTLGKRDLRGGLVLPRDHVAGTRLPVLVDPYGGPHAQRVLSVRAAWLEAQWLADQGFAVLVVDGRGTPGRDPAWEREVHLDFAGPVLEDQVDALYAAAEVEQDLDLTRVGIRGWSFGGWLAALAVLRRPDVFHVGIAGAPVTDWSLYDTFYTQRYLGTPQEQPAAYRSNSLFDDAPTLDRPLMIIHGLADDNVVAAHTLRLSQRLTESGRPHTVLPLTGVTHMTPQEAVAENLLLLQVEFLQRHLRR